MKIDFVSSPFAGHLHPLLDLADQLRSKGYRDIRFISTSEADLALGNYGFPKETVLRGCESTLQSIAHAPQKIGSNPARLIGQLRSNLSMMDQLYREVAAIWDKGEPHVVICDFVVPVAGLLAQSRGLHWWTSLPSVVALETLDGVPSYLGGWMPHKNWYGGVRDRIGRRVIKSFKSLVHRCLKRHMTRIGLPSLYREDGSEAIYSNEWIMGLGVRELEFECTFPKQLEFIGPLTGGPVTSGHKPCFEPNKKHVLISLGTHVAWAKESAYQAICQVAEQMPNVNFHFSGGVHSGVNSNSNNVYRYSYIPYQSEIARYDAVIHHGGTGVMYSCLKNAIPAIVCPQDFDQFDHAARLSYRGLAIWLKSFQTSLLNTSICQILFSAEMKSRLVDFQAVFSSYDPASSVDRKLQAIHSVMGKSTIG